jgi:hypothetical protein
MTSEKPEIPSLSPVSSGSSIHHMDALKWALFFFEFPVSLLLRLNFLGLSSTQNSGGSQENKGASFCSEVTQDRGDMADRITPPTLYPPV